jgi:hypothetical protein
MTLRRALSSLLVVLAAFGALTACGSDSDSDGASATTPTNESGSCPFSGSTKAQELAGEPAPATLTSATPQTDGCIDNVELKFSPSLAGSKFAYQSDAPVLVVTLENTTLGGGVEAGTTNPENLNYVQKVEVTTPEGNVQVAITLDKKRPFLVSSSQLPAEVELSIG